ncbi:MAG: mechanosensitive ion channel family protein [Cryomorphaceae bacterium]
MELDIPKVTSKLADKLEGWLEDFISVLPNIALGIVIVIATVLIGRLIKKLSNKYMQRWGTDETISSFLSKLFYLIVIIMGLMLALSVMELSKTVTSILAGLGILGLALGFAFQDTAANFMSGIYITFNQPFAVGDIVETNEGHMGKVREISLRVTQVETFDGPVVYIPNRFLFEQSFTNYTELGKRRIRLGCGISYGDDLDKVEEVAIEAMQSVEGRLESEEVTVFWTEFGDSSINFTVNIWFEYNRDNRQFLKVRNSAIKKLKAAFDANDIMIPFPIRTLDFGIKGGEKLSEMQIATGGRSGKGLSE